MGLCNTKDKYSAVSKTPKNEVKLEVKHIKTKNTNYYGEILKEQPHGTGTMIVNRGKGEETKYVGQWKNGTFISGEKHISDKIFKGNFTDGHLHGYGTKIINKKDQIIKYEGNFHNGVENGPFKSWNNDKLEFDGIMINGNMVNGTTYGQKGMTYTGDLCYGKPQGKGTVKCYYEHSGDFFDGASHGYGKRKWENGDTYEGNIVKANLQGQGTYTFADGTSLSGIFTYDEQYKSSWIDKDSGKFYPIYCKIDEKYHHRVIMKDNKWTCSCCEQK